MSNTSMEKVIPELPDIGFNIAILPRAPGLNVDCGYDKVFQPAPECARGEFRPGIRPDMMRRSACQKQFVQLIQDILGAAPPRPAKTAENEKYLPLCPMNGSYD